MDNRIAEIVGTAMVPYRLNLEPGDSLAILSDTGTDPTVTSAFMAAAHTLDINAYNVLAFPVPFHHAAPDNSVVKAITGVDLVHIITSKAVVHSAPIRELQKNGYRILASEELNVDMLREGGALGDYEEMNRVGAKIYDLWTKGVTMHVSCPNGTDLRGDITDRPSWLTAAKVVENPGCDLLAAGFPDGEASCAPIEESLEGTIVWDTSMHHVGLLSQPIRADVQQGRAVKISGGSQAKQLIDYLERYGDEGSWIVGETAVGLNESCRITGSVREDKKLAGCMHIALGMNTDVGGAVASRTHVDGVIRYPTLTIDDTVVVREGVLQALE